MAFQEGTHDPQETILKNNWNYVTIRIRRTILASHVEAKVEFADLKFHALVVTGSRYVGSLIGGARERNSWIANKGDDWVYSIQKLAGAARAYTQSAFFSLQRIIYWDGCGGKFSIAHGIDCECKKEDE